MNRFKKFTMFILILSSCLSCNKDDSKMQPQTGNPTSTTSSLAAVETPRQPQLPQAPQKPQAHREPQIDFQQIRNRPQESRQTITQPQEQEQPQEQAQVQQIPSTNPRPTPLGEQDKRFECKMTSNTLNCIFSKKN